MGIKKTSRKSWKDGVEFPLQFGISPQWERPRCSKRWGRVLAEVDWHCSRRQLGKAYSTGTSAFNFQRFRAGPQFSPRPEAIKRPLRDEICLEASDGFKRYFIISVTPDVYDVMWIFYYYLWDELSWKVRKNFSCLWF